VTIAGAQVVVTEEVTGTGGVIVTPEEHGAAGNGTTDDTTAMTLAWAAAKTAASLGKAVTFSLSDQYLCSGGVLTRTVLADCRITITGVNKYATQLIQKADANIMLDTHMTDAAYWAINSFYTPPGKVSGFTINGNQALGGAIGLRNSIVIGAYYDDLLVENYAAAKCVGWKLQNDTDTNSVPRWTEETRFGPGCEQSNCYIGLLFDSATGTSSFGYTFAANFRHQALVAGQTCISVLTSGSTATQLYHSDLSFCGNAGPYSPTTLSIVALGGVTDPGAVAASANFALTVTATSAGIGPGETVALTTTGGTTYLATVRTFADVGATSLALTNGTIALPGSGALTGGSVAVPAGSAGFHAYVGSWAGASSGTTTSLSFAAGTSRQVYAGQWLLLTNAAGTSWVGAIVTTDTAIGATSIPVRSFTLPSGYGSGASAELTTPVLSIGSPTTDTSAMTCTRLNVRMENGSTTYQNWMALAMAAGTSMDVIGGYWDTQTFAWSVATYATFAWAGSYRTTTVKSGLMVGAPNTNANNGYLAVSGFIDQNAAGSGLRVGEGSNAKQGTATLSSGTVVVSNTAVTANSRIFLTAQDTNSTGALRVSARSAGTSFTITSSNAGDSGVVAYEIFEPGV
jgi:hypothetical protein